MPVPIEIDDCRLTLSSAGITERLDFTKRDRQVRGHVTLLIDELHERPDRFSEPVPQLLGVYDQKGHQLLGSHDTTRLDVKISSAMRGSISQDHAGGHGKHTFGFGMEEPLDRIARVEGNLELSSVADLTIIEVSVPELAEGHEIADRCRVRASANAPKHGEVHVTVTVELTVTEASRAAPNAPIRIEVLAQDGSVLGRTTIDSSSSRSDRIVQRSTFKTLLSEGRQIRGLLFHLVRGVEWHDQPFAFENVPLRGRIGP